MSASLLRSTNSRYRQLESLRAGTIRIREQDFGEVVHAGGISPAWRIGYDLLRDGKRFHAAGPGDAVELRIEEGGIVRTVSAGDVFCTSPQDRLFGGTLTPFPVANPRIGGRNQSRPFLGASHVTNVRGCVRP